MAQPVVRNPDDGATSKRQRRAGRHRRGAKEEAQEILSNAVAGEARAPAPPGSQLATRFSRLGLHQEIPELRGQPAMPAASIPDRKFARY